MAAELERATVGRLSDRAAAHLISPRPGPEVCVECFNLTAGFDRCFACAAGEQHLAAVVPISYSLAGGPLHQALAAYKRGADPFVPDAFAELAAILWRFLERHEACVAAAAGVQRFELVTTVPSGDPNRDVRHPLRRIVGELVGPVRDRHERVLRRTTAAVTPRRFDRRRFAATRALDGANVLLIDDTWTSGASAQSAAAALLAGGADRVGGVVIGRHLNPGWRQNRARLHELGDGFDFETCALCAAVARASAA